MNKTVRFPPCNTLRFVKEGLSLPSSYNYPAYGASAYSGTLRQWQQQAPYLQKVQYDDIVCFQVDVQEGCINAEPQLFDHNGTYLTSLQSQAQVYVPGNLTAEGAQFVTLQYIFVPSDIPALDGKEFVYLRLLTQWGTGQPDEHYRSEPLWLRAKHTETVLLEYTNERNDYDTIFEQVKPVFRMRIPSLGLSLRMGGTYTVFENQNHELTKLTGKSYRTFSWEIGGKSGVPDYITDRISHALNCDHFFLEGREYRKEDGAEMEEISEEGNALGYYTILLREAAHQSSYTYGERDVLLWERPATGYPYAMYQVHLTNGLAEYYSGVKVMYSNVEETSLMDAWMAERIAKGIKGSFEEVDGGFYYRQAEGEQFTVSRPVIYNKTLSFTAKVFPSFRYKYTAAGGHVFEAGSGHDSRYCEPGTDITITEGYTPSALVVPRIFHNDDIQSFTFSGGGFQYLTEVSGAAPAGLERWSSNGCQFHAQPSFSLEFLRPAQSKLYYLSLQNCRIKAITAGWGASTLSTSGKSSKPYRALLGIYLDRNDLNASSVDSFLNNLAFGTNYTIGGTVNIATNAGTNPPSSTPLFPSGKTATATLKSAWWSVLHD